MLSGRSLFGTEGRPAPPSRFPLFTPVPAGSLLSFPPLTPQYKYTGLFSETGIPPGDYQVHPYEPTDVLSTFLTIHVLRDSDWKPKRAKTKAEVEDQNRQVLGFLISTKMAPLSHSAAHLLCGSLSRTSGLGLGIINPEVLTKSGVQVSLAFKTDDFVIYHSVNTFTLFALTTLPRRLGDILTSL